MKTLVGTFTVEDAFSITGRGLVLVGKLQGQVAPSYQLILEDATNWTISAVEAINLKNRWEQIGLFINAPVISFQELRQCGIIGAAAQIFAP